MRHPLGLVVLSVVVGTGLVGCAAGGADQLLHGPSATAGTHGARARLTLPTHVMILVQENRTVDNLFQGFPGADTAPCGLDSHNQTVCLTPSPLGALSGPRHSHRSFTTEFNNGLMNGFDRVQCELCPTNFAYTYVNPSEIVPYTQLATQYGLADHVLQMNEGPSFPAHIYLIAGQAGSPKTHWYVAENNDAENTGAISQQGPHNCQASPKRLVTQIDMTTAYPGVEGKLIFPCPDPPTVLDELDQKGIEWRYYTPTTGSIWTAPYAVEHLFKRPADKARVIVPETKVLTDITNHQLAPLSFVIPKGHNSDHPGPNNPNGGPAWVASIVNAIEGDPQYAPNTAIIVVWDDWGGWFDHYIPTHPTSPFGGDPDPYEYGFRVPLLAIGSMAKTGVDHTPRSSAAVVHFIEDVFGLPSLGTLDAQTDDLFTMFNFGQAPRHHKRIDTGKVTIQTLLREPADPSPVDSE